MKKPFDLPKLPVSIDYTLIIKEIGRCRSAIGELSGLLSSSQNPHLLTAPLLTNEAVLSSRIEGTIATVEDVYLVFRFSTDLARSRNAKDKRKWKRLAQVLFLFFCHRQRSA